jgi:xanthine dehydrogenase YagS FAD-binding subunit
VAPTPWRAAAAEKALAGKALATATIEQAAKCAVDDATPLSRNAYKVQLARVAVKRALLEAAGRKG